MGENCRHTSAHGIGAPCPSKKKKKPDIATVLQYAKPLIRKFIGEKASDRPREHKEEIEQTAFVRILATYGNLDPDRGWRAFVYHHCRGAVLDYLKFGVGFEESSWWLSKEEAHESKSVTKLRERVSLVSPEGEISSVEEVAARSGVFSSDAIDRIRIKWDLIARLSAVDTQVHVFAKWIRGYSMEEIAPVFGVSSRRVSQLIAAFIKRMRTPEELEKPWNRQVAFALGIGRQLGLSDCERDQARVFGFELGNNLRPVDLDSLNPYALEQHAQLTLFDEETRGQEEE